MKVITQYIPNALMALMAAGLSAGVASAQSTDAPTADDITEAFEKQRTRGLVIVPSDGSGEDAANQDEGGTQITSETGYEPVDREDQVNLKIRFDFDSAALREDQKPALATMCEVMKQVDVALFQIIGHTDSAGAAAYNENLSLLRAQEVKRHLVTECGIAEDRLEAVGMGESAPFDPDNPRADENRRVEFQALG